MNTVNKLANVRANVLTTPTKSAWGRGVKIYALELLQELESNSEYLSDDVLDDRGALKQALLNGASSWQEYSGGGCALIADAYIAARLCTPSEFKRTKGGERNPNSRETWLDAQARALAQAAHVIYRAASL